ncbi:MAG: hypothetical protein DMF53_01640 [Acidobacteria bacterium]|nr:MAG: hypothetical protein DMF53_01640 [Acidobacteriota bacterium]
MRKSLFVGRAVALAAVLAIGTSDAAFAGAVYVPVPDPVSAAGSTHVVQLWVTNTGTTQSAYTATALDAETDGTQRPAQGPPASQVAAGRTTVLNGIGTVGKVGLLEVATSSSTSIEARLISTAPNGITASVSPVPLISSSNQIGSGQTAILLGLRRDNTHGDYTNLGVINLAHQASQCEIKLFRADGTQIAATAQVTFKPLSLRFFADAFKLLGELDAADARAEVSCNQPFYAYATLYTALSSELLFITPAPTGASTLPGPGDNGTGGGTGGGGGGNGGGGSGGTTTIFTASGTFHTAAPGNEKKTFNITLPAALSLRRMVIEMDVTPGPWNRAKTPGNHAILWLYRDKFRSNTIANVNAFSPPKLSFKAAQNINLPAGSLSQDEQGFSWVQGQRYHLKYTYDAEHNTVTAVLSSGGTAVKTLSFNGTAPNGVLDIPATGLTAEFGHYADQEGPEVASYGWSYANLVISGVSY